MAAGAVVIFAHPYPGSSRAGRALLGSLRDVAGVAVRSLYDLYPDFCVDVVAEQQALVGAEVIVFQTPLYWYTVPSLMHLWFEKVLEHGFAHGPGGHALVGKRALWAVTTGTPAAAYRAGAMHGHSFDAFVHAVEQTARFCGMRWEDPFVVHGAEQLDAASLAEHASTYRARVEGLLARDARDG